MKTREELINILWNNEVEYMNKIGLFDSGIVSIDDKKNWFMDILKSRTDKEIEDAVVQSIINKAERN